jgi:translation initiation factor 2 subunit 2
MSESLAMSEEIPVFDATLKKKKKVSQESAPPPAEKSEEPFYILAELPTRLEWPQEPDVDYTYDDLVGRLYTLDKQRSGNSDDHKLIIQPPKLLRQGRKTIWSNFAEVCNQMHRNLDHVMCFMLAELSSQGSLDVRQQLVVRGTFQPAHFETIICSYVRDYVTCKTCLQHDTMLMRSDRLTFMVCESCSSKRTVPSIQKGCDVQKAKHRMIKDIHKIQSSIS